MAAFFRPSRNMDFPNTTEDAREHIAKIRAEKGLDGPSNNIADLEAALDILSNQLYQKSTHFLLELIQNVDDNTYDNPLPTLRITYKDRCLCISSNEIGFKKTNVEALCRIGRSTKRRTDPTTQSIGEKGIGFKSVFKIADVVWIHSGKYSFKFDKREKLGMIAPIWADFPEKPTVDFTSIMLQLSTEYNETGLIREIKLLDPTLLIFLRKLKRLDLSIWESNGDFWQSSHERHDDQSWNDHQKLIRLQQNGRSLDYIITLYIADQLPAETKRPGCTKSEILLGFPVTESNEAEITSQKVYAFLPIRDYGFKFLLQSDFLLTASREEIDESPRWNQALLDFIPDAFLTSINLLNKGNCRYSWLRYLPNRPPLLDFFELLQETILELISKYPILESSLGDLNVPHNLYYVPDVYRDKNRVPFALYEHTASKYLSSGYSSKYWPNLELLGVNQTSEEDFLCDLSNFISENGNEYKHKSPQWHSSLASRLIPLTLASNKHMSTASKMKMVPLHDGQWVSPNVENLFFPNDRMPLTIPNGIEMMEVHQDVSNDPSRRKLLTILGVKEFDLQKICEVIIKRHSSPEFRFADISHADLVSHAFFLYRAGWVGPFGCNLWFVAENKNRYRGAQLYIDSETAHTTTKCLHTQSASSLFLHSDYLKLSQASRDSFVDWLIQYQKLTSLPRLVSLPEGSRFSLSKDFQFLLDNLPSSQILLLLKDHWKHYAEWIEGNYNCRENPHHKTSILRLRKQLGSINVACKNNTIVPLNTTLLPLSNMKYEEDLSSSLLDVPNPDDPSWSFLSILGVTIKADVKYFIQQLQALKGGEPSLERASSLYYQIYLSSYGDLEFTRKSFTEKPLIFIPIENNGSTSNWVLSKDCVWSGDACLKKTIYLSRHYPQLKAFFLEILHIQDSYKKTLIEEIHRITANDSPKYISQLFRALDLQLTEVTDEFGDQAIKSLCERSIFPINEVNSLHTAQENDIWFIADRQHLRQSFEELLPLLNFTVQDITNMKKLTRVLGLNSRLLSNVAIGRLIVEGSPMLDVEYTNLMRRKSSFVARLLSHDTPPQDKDKIHEKLRTVKVYSARKINLEWSVKLPGDDNRRGRPDFGQAKLISHESSLQIILDCDEIDFQCPPLELIEGLCNFCGIHELERVSILTQVLIQCDIEKIKKIFEKKNIPDTSPEIDLDISTVPQADADHSIEDQRGGGWDSLEGFLATVKSLQRFASRHWEHTECSDLNSFFLHICKLENQNPYFFLPHDALHFKPQYGDTPHNGDITHVFCSGRDLSAEERFSGTTLVLPAFFSVPKKGSAVLTIINDALNVVNAESIYVAELSVSALFEKHLGDAYSPEVQWTSNLRSRAGYKPYEYGNTYVSPFKIKDDTGAFARFLEGSGYKRAARWRNHPTFHIEVVATETGLKDCQFYLNPKQVQKAQELSTARTSSRSPSDIFILICVFDIRKRLGMALFVDPWSMYLQGEFHLSNFAHYKASFNENAPHIFLKDPVQKSFSSSFQIDQRLGGAFKKLRGQRNPQHLLPSSDGPYQHKPLNGSRDFRLVEIFAGEDEIRLKGVIRHYSLDCPENYKAISYCWGTDIKPFKLETHEGFLSLTPSLASALRNLRDSKASVLIWADAICIDQENKHEKRIQIRLMREIYQLADCVHAWIGIKEDESDEAIVALLQVYTIAANPDHWPESLPRIPLSWTGRKVPCSEDSVWGAINKLFQREWFKRAWIVQEVIVASRVVISCGSWNIRWDEMFGALDICETEAYAEPHSKQTDASGINLVDTVYTLRQTRRMYNNNALSRRYSLLTLFELFSYTNATEECDKLFALLGLASDADDDEFNPDYDSPLETVVRRFARVFIRRGDTIELLYRAGTSKSYEFASWIPYWTRNAYPRTISTWDGARGTFSASGGTQLRASLWPEDENILMVRGTWVDSITYIAATARRDNNIISFMNSICASIESLKSYPTGETVEQLKQKLPIGDAKRPHIETGQDTLSGHRAHKSSEDIQNDSFDFTGVILKCTSPQDLLDSLNRPQNIRDNTWNFWRTVAAFSERIPNGRFCTTERGYAGFAPSGAQVGDTIWILNGGAVPFMLRDRETREGGSVLIGECYIHGIMHGEALNFEGIYEQDIFLA